MELNQVGNPLKLVLSLSDRLLFLKAVLLRVSSTEELPGALVKCRFLSQLGPRMLPHAPCDTRLLVMGSRVPTEHLPFIYWPKDQGTAGRPAPSSSPFIDSWQVT